MIKQVLQHFLYFTLCVIIFCLIGHYTYLFSNMNESFYILFYFLGIIFILGFLIYKNIPFIIKIVFFLLLCECTNLFLNQFSELVNKKQLDIGIRASDSYCEEYFQCVAGTKITRGKETFIMNKENCLKYDWEWNEEKNFCKIFQSWFN